jgi:hypothetical protein
MVQHPLGLLLRAFGVEAANHICEFVSQRIEVTLFQERSYGGFHGLEYSSTRPLHSAPRRAEGELEQGCSPLLQMSGIKNMERLWREVPRVCERGKTAEIIETPSAWHGRNRQQSETFPCFHGTTSAAHGKREEARKSWVISVGMRVTVRFCPYPSRLATD